MRRFYLIVCLMFIPFICFAQQNLPGVIYGSFDAHSTKTYKIQVGAYFYPANAQNVITRLKNHNLIPVSEKYLQYSRVLLRSIPARDVVNTLKTIKRAGFNEVWIQQDIQATPSTTTHRPSSSLSQQQGNNYYYGSVSVVTGLLTTETVTLIDNKGTANIFILITPNPINVFTANNDFFDETVYGISKIQLAAEPGYFTAYKDKQVRLTGDFYYWHTAHHFTEVLMYVTKIEVL